MRGVHGLNPSLVRSDERGDDDTLGVMTRPRLHACSTRGLALLLLATTFGCPRGNAEPRSPSEKASFTPSLDAVPDDLSGCRSPAEPACDQCCREISDTCAIHATDPRFDEYGPLGYRLTERLRGRCSPSCPLCARCSAHAESELRARRAERPQCNCTLAVNEDPCWQPNGCSCFCEQLRPLAEACPSLAGSM